jgi:hypothetical protein
MWCEPIECCASIVTLGMLFRRCRRPYTDTRPCSTYRGWAIWSEASFRFNDSQPKNMVSNESDLSFFLHRFDYCSHRLSVSVVPCWSATDRMVGCDWQGNTFIFAKHDRVDMYWGWMLLFAMLCWSTVEHTVISGNTASELLVAHFFLLL